MPKMCRGFNFPLKQPGEIAGGLAGFYRDIVQCIRRDLTSSENPDFVSSSFFHSKRSHLNKGYPQNCIFEKDHHLQKIIHFHKSQPPTGLKQQQQQQKQQPRHPPQKYSALPLKAPPLCPPPHIFHLEQLSVVVFWCARIHVQFI